MLIPQWWLKQMGNLDENINELKTLLGERFIKDNTFNKHPIRQAIDSVLIHHANKDFASRDYINGIITMLVKNLQEVKNGDEKTFKTFSKSIVNSNDDTYFGIRMEISTAASLIRYNIEFEKTESPDFTLGGEWTGLFIECGSVHLSQVKDSSKDLKYKISSVLKEKGRKVYDNDSTALFVDFTNINFQNMVKHFTQEESNLKNYVYHILKGLKFGSVILFFYMVNMDSNKYQWKYHRIDNTYPHELLVKFLNSTYPLGRDVTHKYGFPSKT
jgi:hypothetical protein